MAPPAKTAMATTRANFSGLMVFSLLKDGLPLSGYEPPPPWAVLRGRDAPLISLS